MSSSKEAADRQFIRAFRQTGHDAMLSQKAQDFWVASILGEKQDGFFLDLAAADGRTHSNTFYFEKVFNWRGILIEPNPTFFTQLEQNRTGTCINEVVSNACHSLEFRYDNGQRGGIVASDTDNSPAARGDELPAATIEQRMARPLTDILDELEAPDYIDYFSLDVEGAEERVIAPFDFKKYRFGLLTIERALSLIHI